jgi:putative flippase GtrA
MKRLLRFGAVGTVGFVVDATILLLLVQVLDVSPLPARCLSFVSAATVTFWLNQRFTFDAGSSFSMRRWSSYVFAMTLGACINLGVYHAWVVYQGASSSQLLLGTAAGSLAGMFCNYFVSSLWIFPTARSPSSAAE